MIGKNLKYYRLQNKLTKKAMAEKIGVTAMSITHYENDERMPDMRIIRQMMAVLNVKLADFLSARNNEHVYVHGEFRRNSTLSEQSQEYIRESVEEYLDRFFTVIAILGKKAVPEPPACRSLSVTQSVEADARQLRQHLGFALEGPVQDLVGAMENKGILIYVFDMDSDKFSGMSGFVDDYPYVILNNNMTAERQRSILVHELAHLFLRFPEDMDEKAVEQYATAVSGAFLFPQSDAYRELGLKRTKITKDMIMVAKEYGISMLMLAKRAEILKIVSEPLYREFMIQASQNNWRKYEPSRIPKEQPELFRQLVIRAIGEGEITPQRAAELLKAPYDHVMSMVRIHGED